MDAETTDTSGDDGELPEACLPDDPVDAPEWDGCPAGTPVAEADFPLAAAAALCGLYVDCSCNSIYSRFSDLDACIEALREPFATRAAAAQAAGLGYDPELAGAAIESWRAVGCELDSTRDLSACACPPYHGSLDSGAQDCQQAGEWSSCQAGLGCAQDGGDPPLTCQAVCWAYAGEGQRCGTSSPRCFDPDVDLYCNDEREMCDRVPEVGQACSYDGRCADDGYCPGGDDCQALQTCTDLPSIGQPCGDKWPGGGAIDIYGACEPGATCERVEDQPTCVDDGILDDGSPCVTRDECRRDCIQNVCASPAQVCKMSHFQD